MTAPRVSIVVPVYNKAPFLKAVLDSILAAARAYGDAELIVVDHGSTDGSRTLVESRYAGDARILDVRGGTIAAARNCGARAATGTVLSFIDADCLVPPDYFAGVAEVLATTGAGATGAEVVPPASPSWVEDVWYRLHRRSKDGDQAWIGSANFAVRREAFESVGGFDERLVTGEDTELCQRLRDHGVRIYEAKRLTAVHLDNAKTVGDFYRKEAWRALGMFGTVRWSGIDKPTVTTIAHMVLLAAAIAVLVAAPLPWPARLIGAPVLAIAAPAATVLYRVGAGGAAPRLDRAILLYEVYFTARGTALARLLFRRV